jgi:5-methylcytosine-specific restriction protein B
LSSWDEFNRRLNQRYPGIQVQTPPSVGSANSARFLANAFKAGIANLQRRSRFMNALEERRPWAWVSKIIPVGPRDSELYVCLVFSGDNLRKLEERLSELDRRADAGLGKGTNNTRFLLHSSGFYATTASESDRIDPESDADAFGAPLPVDEIVYADVAANGKLTPQEVDIVQRLRRDYTEPEKIVRLEVDGVVESFVRLPEKIEIEELLDRVAELGGHYSRETLESFHLNLIHNPQKHFVILRGISGTGKSRLTKCYAYSVLGLEGLDVASDRFVVVPVEPQWTDPSFLTGHEDVLAPGGYRRTAFLDALVLANSDPLKPVFVLLDEMNRAQVEHYFANFLSAMEIEGAIRFHAADSIDIPDVPQSIPWPRNLYLIGTINDDESVLPFSSMVLDRANSQDLSDVNVRAYGKWLRDREPELATTLTDELLEELTAINELLAPFQLHFGHRTVRELALYVTRANSIQASIDPVDRQIDQKILPKLRGGAECTGMLNSLAGLLNTRPLAHRRVSLMKSDLDESDFFKYR